MRQPALPEDEYGALLTDLKQLLVTGRDEAQVAVAQVLVKMYWHMGQRLLASDVLNVAGAGEAILRDLAAALSLDVSSLKRSMYLVQTYPKQSDIPVDLSWSHCKILVSISDEEKRSWYQKAAQAQKWSTRKLAMAVTNKHFEQQSKVSVEGKNNQSLPQLTRPSDPSYVYKAQVVRVIDGDTVLVNIDLGFQVLKQQRLRFAGIEAPELDTPTGEQSYQYLKTRLESVEQIVLKTNKIDIYGRYVAHIFIAETKLTLGQTFTQGIYLNQEMIDKNMAGAF